MSDSFPRPSLGPKHKRISDELRILAHSLDVGGRLPSERELAANYGCNFLTIRKALLPLVEDGTVVRVTGRGTFVARRAGESGEAKRKCRIGLLLTPENNAYARRVVQSIAQEASRQNVELRSVWVKSIVGDGLAQARALRDEGCSALTIPWFPHDRAEELRAFVRDCPLPLSLPLLVPGLEELCFEEPAVFGASIASAVESLCRYHRQLGRAKLAFLGPDAMSDPLLQRMLGAYTLYTAREQMPSYCGLVGPDALAIQKLAGRWREYRGELAVICYDDAHALRLMTAMHKLGLSCPRDYTVTGINDSEASRFSDPPLSTVRQDFAYIGRWLLSSAVARAEGSLVQSKESPPHCLIVRGTCGGDRSITPELTARFPTMTFDVSERSGAFPLSPSARAGRESETLSVA